MTPNIYRKVIGKRVFESLFDEFHKRKKIYKNCFALKRIHNYFDSLYFFLKYYEQFFLFLGT